MVWWFAITLIIAAALAYGYWDHTSQSRHLAGLYSGLATKYQGKVKKANLLALPQLRFEKDGHRFLVSAMVTSGQVVAGSSGYSGPFTFVDLYLPFDTAQMVHVERSDANLLGSVSSLIEATTPWKRQKTGIEKFDRAFNIKWKD